MVHRNHNEVGVPLVSVALLVPVSVTTSDGIPYCSACDITNEGERRCTECLCAYCGAWRSDYTKQHQGTEDRRDVDGAALMSTIVPRPGTTPPLHHAPLATAARDDAREGDVLLQCGKCAQSNDDDLFGMTRVHWSCYVATRHAAWAFLDPPICPAVVCHNCKSIVMPEAVKLAAESFGQDDNACRTSTPTCAAGATSPATVVSKVKQETPSEEWDASEAAATYYSGVPDVMHALLHSDPRQCTFETQHFGALRLALELTDNAQMNSPRAHAVPAREGQSRSGGGAPRQSPRLLQLCASSLFPAAAHRIQLRRNTSTGDASLQLAGLPSSALKKRNRAPDQADDPLLPFPPDGGNDGDNNMQVGIAGARRRARLDAEAEGKAHVRDRHLAASLVARQDTPRRPPGSSLVLDAQLIDAFLSSEADAAKIRGDDEQ